MGRVPRVNTKKEYDSPLHYFRVAKGMTVKDLIEAAETNVNMIVGLAKGDVAPLDHEGHVKPVVQRLCEVLDVPVEELFPLYINKEGLTIGQLVDALHSQSTPDQGLDRREFNQVIADELTPVELAVIHARFYNNASLREAAEVLKMSDENVRVIERDALRKLRRPGSQVRHFYPIEVAS